MTALPSLRPPTALPHVLSGVVIRRTLWGIIPLASYTGTDFYSAQKMCLECTTQPGHERYWARKALNRAYDSNRAVWHKHVRITVH